MAARRPELARAKLDPRRGCEGEQFAARRVQGGSGQALATLDRAPPTDRDVRLAGARELDNMGGQSPEQNSFALEIVDRPAGGAVESRPDQLPRYRSAGFPGRRNEPVAPRDRPRVDGETVLPVRSADEARRVSVVEEAREIARC